MRRLRHHQSRRSWCGAGSDRTYSKKQGKVAGRYEQVSAGRLNRTPMRFVRKILVGLVALAFIVGAYVMYSRSSKTPTIKIGGGADVNDINVPTFDGQGGRIGPATVDVLRGTTYIHRDAKTKRIDREFGFAELVRTIGETWEVDKPWMKVYQQDFQLDITADRGITEIQTVVGSSTPKDAIFQGNVTIRILPLEQKKYRETTIHLDNLIFLSDKSQFSTAGPVK